eukprot:g72.t1
MWSVGCIFAELLTMMKENVANHRDRKPIFPGKSCFPLTADNKHKYSDDRDQLNVIFDIIGTPSEEECRIFKGVQSYLSKLPKKKPVDLSTIWKGCKNGSPALDLLKKMLHFDPAKRITMADALAHPFFATVRKEEREATGEILSMDPHIRDLLACELADLIYEEIVAFKKELNESE